jgi:hypothetical protein
LAIAASALNDKTERYEVSHGSLDLARPNDRTMRTSAGARHRSVPSREGIKKNRAQFPAFH